MIAALIAASAALLVAWLTANTALLALTLTKEQKTSEFRQQWIDGLRLDLSQFFGAARAFGRAVESKQAGDQDLLPLSAEKISELRYQAAETFSRIVLRLNYLEPLHENLLTLLKAALDQQNEMSKGRATFEDVKGAIDAATDQSRRILKTEWERVKGGEPAFTKAYGDAQYLVQRLSGWVVIAVVVVLGAAVISWTGFPIRP